MSMVAPSRWQISQVFAYEISCKGFAVLTKVPTLEDRYEALVAAGELTRDPAQLAALAALDRLAGELAAPADLRKPNFRLPFSRPARRPSGPRGVYLWGEVGRGKTTLMDLFFETAPVERKRRVHFFAFMAEAHERLHRARMDANSYDPVMRVAHEIGRETKLLCFDEFAVNDIADATILARLFAGMFAEGLVLVATSNVEPWRLYEKGRNRELFVPFISVLLEHVQVIQVGARVDFRFSKPCAGETFFVAKDEPGQAAARDAVAREMGETPSEAQTLKINGHHLDALAVSGRAARFDFAQICGRPLGASDYLALTRRFATIVVENVPQMAWERRNEARRFMTLIDVLYERKTKLLLTAAVEAEDIYRADYGAEAKEFPRTLSRLAEMRSRDYLDAVAARVSGRAASRP